MKFCGFDNARLRRSTEKEDRIIGGTTVDKKITVPWVVRLEFSNTGETDTTRCAGTVVSKKFILTTNSCCEVSFFHFRWSKNNIMITLFSIILN